MKKAVLLLSIMCCFILSSCKDEAENNANCSKCSFENPLTDLPWLKTMVNGFVQDSVAGMSFHVRIYQCTYKTNKTGFLIEPCVDCPDAGYSLYSCKGVVLCGGGGIIGGDTCEEFNIDRDNATLIYEQHKQ